MGGKQMTHIILFYKYHALSSNRTIMELYRQALENLCSSLELKGRILVGCSDNSEGVNGTLAGTHLHVRAFTYAMLGETHVNQLSSPPTQQTRTVLETFWSACQEFARQAHVPVLRVDSPEDFKWSKSTVSKDVLFPDLNIKLVKEMIGTGGEFSSITVQDTSRGYLTPSQWHDELRQGLDPSKTVLIDCRNAKECAIGHFPNALDPRTANFSQFPGWVQENREKMQGKKVLMYCTGGIRCEKASAYIRKTVPDVGPVQHLQGGIHKYLERFGTDGLWKGKNFVFDARGAATATETRLGKDTAAKNVIDLPPSSTKSNSPQQNETIVGRCLYCQTPYDVFHPGCVCTVCREPTLACPSCQSEHREFHCQEHFHLRFCYFTNLAVFTSQELETQRQDLETQLKPIEVGKRYKQRRATLRKQIAAVEQQMEKLANSRGETQDPKEASSSICRSCGDAECTGSCWGFHGLQRKRKLEDKQQDRRSAGSRKTTSSRKSAGQRNGKQMQRQRDVEDIQYLKLARPCSEYRNPETGIRVPPPCTRLLQTTVKGKWCGLPALRVMKTEFTEIEKELPELVANGLLRCNDRVIRDDSVVLQNMDVISRVVYWHEPPVLVPPSIPVQRVELPQEVVQQHRLKQGEIHEIFVCNKPSSVPVHPAGPYLSNSLTMMVEAQETMLPRSLRPCHRIDRATSGITICSPSVDISRIIQSKFDIGLVRKLYIAKVQGRFPDGSGCLREAQSELILAKLHGDIVEVRAPIKTADPKNGLRVVSEDGKDATSRFRCLSYDSESGTSIVSCYPVTGRSHQLRVHLQWLGYPVCGDVQYGGPCFGSVSKMTVIEEILKSCNADHEATSPQVSSEDARLARKVSRCCRDGQDGVKLSFTPAQLLQGGHAICLHALKYSITFPNKKIKGEQLATMRIQVDLPEWASNTDTNHLTWLDIENPL